MREIAHFDGVVLLFLILFGDTRLKTSIFQIESLT